MPRLLHLAVAIAVLLSAVAPASLSRVSAQGTPEAQRYGSEGQGYAGQFADVLNELDAFWLGIFEASGAVYRPPAVAALEEPVTTARGPRGPENFAFYCSADETIYYSPDGFADHDRRIGDFAPIVVTAHEWGHHVQWLAGIAPGAGNAFELQADCLAGAYASDAGQRGLLDPGDVTEAVTSSAEAGDPLGLPQDALGAHGINDARVTSFMRGRLDGVTGRGIQLSSSARPPSQPPAGPPTSNTGPAPPSVTTAAAPALSALVPSVLELPRGQPFRVVDEGATTLDALERVMNLVGLRDGKATSPPQTLPDGCE